MKKLKPNLRKVTSIFCDCRMKKQIKFIKRSQMILYFLKYFFKLDRVSKLYDKVQSMCLSFNSSKTIEHTYWN